MRKNQRGTFIVEFAIIAAVMFIVLFAAIELSRLIWLWNTVDEATRRGARLAAVCEMKDPNVPVQEATIFASPGKGPYSPILRGLETDHVYVEYFKSDGSTEASTFEDVRYVRVSIVGYEVTPLIPFFTNAIILPT